MKNTPFRLLNVVLALSLLPLVSVTAQTEKPQTPAANSAPSNELPGISGDVGISQKSSSVYRRLGRRAMRSLQDNNDPFFILGSGEATSSATRNEFEQYCLDTDHSDVVSWQTTSTPAGKTGGKTITKITFSCVLDTEYPKIRERIFVFSYESVKSSKATSEAPRLADIQIAAADIAVDPDSSLRQGFDKSVGESSNSVLATPAGKVAVAISGAVLSSGASALTDSDAKADSNSNERPAPRGSVGKEALLAGLSAALSHFMFDVAPSSSGLSGGALSIVVEDLQAKRSKGLHPTISPTGLSRANQSGLSPITVYLTFKF